MKIIITVLAFFLVLPVFLVGLSISFVVPKVGEFYPQGVTLIVNWNTVQFSSESYDSGYHAVIYLYQGSSNLGVIKDTFIQSYDPLYWIVGQYQGGMAPVGGNYHLHIHAEDPIQGFVEADSPVFNIGPPWIGTMNFTFPTAGSQLLLNRTYRITWNKSPKGTHFKKASIKFFCGNQIIDLVSKTENDGVFEWHVPGSLGVMSNVWLEISSTFDGWSNIKYESTAKSPTFSIHAIILDPMGKDILTCNSTQNISWQVGEGILGPARIELLRKGALVGVIGNVTSNLDATRYSFSWNVCKLLGTFSVIAAGDGYRIRVSYPAAGAKFMDQTTLFGLRLSTPLPLKPIKRK